MTFHALVAALALSPTHRRTWDPDEPICPEISSWIKLKAVEPSAGVAWCTILDYCPHYTNALLGVHINCTAPASDSYKDTANSLCEPRCAESIERLFTVTVKKGAWSSYGYSPDQYRLAEIVRQKASIISPDDTGTASKGKMTDAEIQRMRDAITGVGQKSDHKLLSCLHESGVAESDLHLNVDIATITGNGTYGDRATKPAGPRCCSSLTCARVRSISLSCVLAQALPSTIRSTGWRAAPTLWAVGYGSTPSTIVASGTQKKGSATAAKLG